MSTINITEFKQNIGTYFDTIVLTRKPLYITRRRHTAMIMPLDNISPEDLAIIQEIQQRAGNKYIEVKDAEWVNTFNKISGTLSDTVTLG